MGFDDLRNVNILKYATLIRDPLTMEMTVTFDTRPSKTDEARNLAWNKIHQDAITHLKNDYMKKQQINQNATINDIQSTVITNKQYCIFRDPDYIQINHNESTCKLYD